MADFKMILETVRKQLVANILAELRPLMWQSGYGCNEDGNGGVFLMPVYNYNGTTYTKEEKSLVIKISGMNGVEHEFDCVTVEGLGDSYAGGLQTMLWDMIPVEDLMKVEAWAKRWGKREHWRRHQLENMVLAGTSNGDAYGDSYDSPGAAREAIKEAIVFDELDEVQALHLWQMLPQLASDIAESWGVIPDDMLSENFMYYGESDKCRYCGTEIKIEREFENPSGTTTQIAYCDGCKANGHKGRFIMTEDEPEDEDDEDDEDDEPRSWYPSYGSR